MRPIALARDASLSDDSKRLVLMGDWNAILDPKLDKSEMGASRSDRCESSQIDLLDEHDLVDRFRLDHPAREMWTWLGDLPSGQIRSYLDRVLEEQTVTSLHRIGKTDHKLVRVNLRLVNKPSLTGYWKFNIMLEIGDFWERLETLIQWALTGAVIGNKWWGSLSYRIRDFAIKYGRQLKLYRAKKTKSLDDRLFQTVEMGDSLAVDLAWRDLEREASERYKGFVVRARLNRVSNEAVKCNVFVREEEVRRFPHRYIEFFKFLDGHALGRIVRCTMPFGRTFVIALLAVHEFHSYLTDFPHFGEAEAASCESLVTECKVRDALKQVGLNKSPGLDGLPYEVYLRMSLMFVPILTEMSIP